MADVTLNIVADTKKASKSITTFGKSATKSLRSITNSFSALKVAAAGAVTFLAGRQLLRAVGELTEAASIQEDAINELNTSLRLTGKFTAEASRDIQKFASTVQQSSRFGDEAVLQNAALIQSLGNLSTDGLKQATQAAVDLSAALKIDLRSASLLVGKAAAGEVSSFSRYGLVIKKGADNADTFAKALTAIQSKFGGAAAAQINTFSGAMEQLSNIQGDLNEELGFSITRNPLIINGIKLLSKFYLNLIEVVNNNQEEITSFINKGLKGVISIVPSVIRSVAFVSDAFIGLISATSTAIYWVNRLVSSFLRWKFVTTTVNALVKSWDMFTESVVFGVSLITRALSSVPGANEIFDFESATKDLDALRMTIAEADVDFGSSINNAADSVEDFGVETLKAGNESRKFFDKISEGAQKVGDIAEEQVKKFKGLADGTIKIDVDQTGSGENINASAAAAATDVKESISAGAKDLAKKFFGYLRSGARGAKKLFSDVAGIVGDAFFPGFGGLIKEATSFFLQNPEAIKAQIKGFIDALPDVVAALQEGLIAGLPVFIDRLVTVFLVEGGLERIAKGLVSIMPEVAKALVVSIAEAMKKAFNALFNTLNDKLRIPEPDWIKNLANVFNATPNWVSKLEIKTPTWFNRLKIQTPEWLGRLKVGGGGDGGTLGKIGRSLGFASGGLVPGGYPNDTYPARLTSNELVTPPRTTNNLFRLIDKLATEGETTPTQETSTQPIQINLSIGEQELADVLLNLNRQGFRTA